MRHSSIIVSGWLRFIGLAGIIAFGFITIVATGGGGGDSDWLYPIWVQTCIAVQDINGDGRNDVLTLARYSTSSSNHQGRLKVYLQTNQGDFETPSTYAVGKYPWQLVVHDMNDDGSPDVLVSDPDEKNVQLLLQDPATPGRFLTPQQIADGMTAYSSVVADFDDDGTPDAAIGDVQTGAGRIVLLYQDSGAPGTFLPATDLTIPGSSSSLLAAGDLDGDGLDDLLAWIYLAPSGYVPNGTLAIGLQQLDGTIGPMSTLAPQSGLNVGYLAISDYNNDGRNDLFVFFTPFSPDYTAKLTVVLQEALPGTFSLPVDTSLDGIKGIDGAVVSDLNGDGRPDFAVVGFFPEGSPSEVKSRLNLFLQSGNGAFALAEVHELPIDASRVAAGDLDNDGRNDLAVLGGSNQVMVLIQSHSVAGAFNSPVSLP